jgi:2'-5' RNA ligase
LDLDATSLALLARISETILARAAEVRARWTPLAAMHVTLKFLGNDFPADAAMGLGESLRAIASRTPGKPFPIRLDAFPSREGARTIVALLDDHGSVLAALAKEVDDLAFAFGAPRETRPYRPHVTLARLKHACDARDWLPSRPAPCECIGSGVTLYRSNLAKDGSTYVRLASFPLGHPDPESTP